MGQKKSTYLDWQSQGLIILATTEKSTTFGTLTEYIGNTWISNPLKKYQSEHTTDKTF